MLSLYPMRKIFAIHTANITGDTANTGIVEYAARLSNTHNTPNINSRFLSNSESATLKTPESWVDVYTKDRGPREMMEDFCRHNVDQMESLINSSANANNAQPVLIPHLGGRTGFQINPNLLYKYPNVVISHEFSRLNDDQKGIRIRQLMAADNVLFTTDNEKKVAIEEMRSQVSDQEAQKLEDKSSVYPVPPNITPEGSIPSVAERCKDIVVFGMIKKDKGLESLPAIASAMKQDPYFQNRKIHIIGTVLTRGGNGHEILQNSLISEIYPGITIEALKSFSAEEIIKLVSILESKKPIPQQEDLTKNLNHVLNLVGVKHGEIPSFTRKLPLYLHLNQNNEEVSNRLKSTLYSFLPIPRGATDHSGTIAASLAHHMITFAKRNESETSPFLQNGSMNFIDDPMNILQAIKDHELKAKNDNSYEARMIEQGSKFREARDWNNLANHLNQLIQLSVNNHQAMEIAA